MPSRLLRLEARRRRWTDSFIFPMFAIRIRAFSAHLNWAGGFCIYGGVKKYVSKVRQISPFSMIPLGIDRRLVCGHYLRQGLSLAFTFLFFNSGLFPCSDGVQLLSTA
jgi:hypothetical protein